MSHSIFLIVSSFFFIYDLTVTLQPKSNISNCGIMHYHPERKITSKNSNWEHTQADPVLSHSRTPLNVFTKALQLFVPHPSAFQLLTYLSMAVKAGVSESEGGQVVTQRGQLAHTESSSTDQGVASTHRLQHTGGRTHTMYQSRAYMGVTKYSQATPEISRN